MGVLALQGDFIEHMQMLQGMGVDCVEVRLPDQLDGLDGIIIPGGESTTLGKLAVHYGLMDALVEFGREKAIWGTCAGAILLSKDAHREQPLLGLMDIVVERNAFGRQIASFEVGLLMPALGSNGNGSKPYPAIFIRAPLIEEVGEGVEVLARLPQEGMQGRIVAARQGKLLATSFHPELTTDERVHRYFTNMALGLI